MGLTIATKDRRFSWKMDEEKCEALFNRIVSDILAADNPQDDFYLPEVLLGSDANEAAVVGDEVNTSVPTMNETLKIQSPSEVHKKTWVITHRPVARAGRKCLLEKEITDTVDSCIWNSRKWRFEARRLPAEGGQASDKRMKELEQQNKHFGENGDAEERQEWKERMLRNFLRGHE